MTTGISNDTAKNIKTDNDETEDRINIEEINITTEMNIINTTTGKCRSGNKTRCMTAWVQPNKMPNKAHRNSIP